MHCPSNPGIDSPFKVPLEDTWRDDNTCSYCGSMNPDEFMFKVKEGAKLTPADKDYKVYIDGYNKFYFEHLSKEQKLEFIILLNTNKLQIEYPGYFYVLPYFIAK